MQISGAVFVLLLLQSKIVAETPTVTAVVNDATGDARLSPGVFARVYYTPSISDWFYPVYHETVTIYMGGRKALILAGESPAKVLLPRELRPGPADLVLTTGSGNSAPFPIMLDAYSPGLYSDNDNLLANTATYCASRQSGRILANAVGLGATDPAVPTLDLNGGSAPTVAKPTATVGGRTAEVLHSQLSLPHMGLYQVDIRPALDTPEGLQPVVLTVEGRTSNPRNVLIGTSTALATGQIMRAALESLATATGCARPLAAGEFTGDPKNPPATLGGTTVKVTDSAGIARMAPLRSVSPLQVDYIVPAGTASGRASVTITSADGSVSIAPMEIESTAPGVFYVPCCVWSLAPKGYVVRVRNGIQTIEPLFPPGCTPTWALDNKCAFLPIDLGPETDEVYLTIYGTGLRNRSSLASVTVKIGAVDALVVYAGPQGEYAGLDQVNVRLPRSLAGQSDGVWVELRIEGKAANYTLVYFK